MRINQSVFMAGTLALIFTTSTFAQTNLQFTAVHATGEGAIQLYWTSTNHELYAVQYANALATNADGSTAWNTLYDQYPSHGTNTFVGDFGNYDVVPVISHPKNSSMRFYRIVDEGTDSDTTDTPSITIASPTNGDVLSGEITVTVSATCSNLPIITTELYVDGQQMDSSDDHSNYVINTCEWPNGPHTLFAVATARSGMSGPSGNYPIYTSHGVSSYMPVTFSNLISQIAFSQQFFQPSLGQTQEVTATFAANCDWTLQIMNEDSNIVRNASGSGNSMTFDWDGTGDGETNIPDGVYYYHISAETNGAADEIVTNGSGSGGGNPPLPELNSSELWVMSANGNDATPLSIFPPEFDTNGLTVFSATPLQVQAARSPFAKSASFESEAANLDYSGPQAQASVAPTRPPTSPNKNVAGTYGVAYFDWPSPQTVSIPKNGLSYPLTGVCHLDVGNSSIEFTAIPEGPEFAANFMRVMSKHGWQIQYERDDSLLHANDMRRNDDGYNGGQLFTTAEIGLFLDHGDYGTDPDYSSGSSGSYQTYFRSSSDSGDDGWLRMCQIGFGGDLKWMGILACNSLNTFDSMSSAGAIPLKTTHMVCGCATAADVSNEFGQLWAQKMFGSFFHSPEEIKNAWYDAGHDQYIGSTNTATVIFRVACYPECLHDTLKDNSAPNNPSSTPGDLTHEDRQVWP